MAETSTAPDWIYPGADVVVYRDDHRRNGSMHYRVTKVVRVAAQSFTVEDEDERFKLADLASKSLGGSWNSFRYRVVPVGSETHYTLRAAKKRERIESDAHGAAHDWMSKRADLAAIGTVIETFTALRDELNRLT